MAFKTLPSRQAGKVLKATEHPREAHRGILPQDARLGADGVMTNGLEPRLARWQLEQQCAELSLCKPEQQQPVEQQQQQRLPRRLLALSPMGARLIGPSSHQFPK